MNKLFGKSVPAMLWGGIAAMAVLLAFRGVVAVNAQAGDPKTLTRNLEPVVLKGSQVAQLLGAPADDLFVYTFSGNTLTGQIPLQIDRVTAAGVYTATQPAFLAAYDEVELAIESNDVTIPVSLGCSLQGLTGIPVGDLPKLAQLGELNFFYTDGIFLPDPALMETPGRSWTQSFAVRGAVTGYQNTKPIRGEIRQGRATAVYTAAGFENLSTTLGKQPAVLIEQQLTLDLPVMFNTATGNVSAKEIINLTTVYWFVKDLGPLKMEWQGGSIEQAVGEGPDADRQIVVIAPLPAEYVTEICGLLASHPQDCILLTQPEAVRPRQRTELTFPALIIPPDRAMVSSTNGAGGAGGPGGSGGAGNQPDDSAAGNQAAIMAYAENVAQIGEKITAAGETFGAAAMAYRSHEITLDTFKQAFAEFKPVVTGLIRQIAALSPPPEATGVHQQLTAGLTACHEAVGLMDQWFDTQDSDLKAATALLVAGCLEQVEAAEKELARLVNAGAPAQ